MPGLEEQYERVEIGQRPNAADSTIPVRVGVAQPGDEVVEIRYQRIQKGGYLRFVTLTEENIWPWEEKLGARPTSRLPRGSARRRDQMAALGEGWSPISAHSLTGL
jgi:hypothetical protein